MTVSEWLDKTTKIFRENKIPSARLDAELILFFALNFSRIFRSDFREKTPKFSREFLLAHDDFELGFFAKKRADNFAKNRVKRIPLAYIFREKEFYGRKFYVNENVLIPRPETEEIVRKSLEILHENFAGKRAKILEVGTGSGIIATTILAEFRANDPQIIAGDISRKALKIARKNVRKFANENIELGGNSRKIKLVKSDLLANIPDQKFDLIVANLPYVSRKWDATANSPELKKEPALALFADDDGNALNKKLIQQITEKNALTDGGFVVLEMDPEQLDAVSNFAKKYGFREVSREPYCLVMKFAGDLDEHRAANDHDQK
jgi:release factor glutamine methyltransferase